MQMLPLAEDLVRQGHRVFVALRELDRAGAIYARSGVSFLQAPLWLSGAGGRPSRKDGRQRSGTGPKPPAAAEIAAIGASQFDPRCDWIFCSKIA